MLGEVREPLGRRGRRFQDYVPGDWECVAAETGELPKQFAEVHPGKLVRSGIPWAHQVRYLHDTWDVQHVVSLVEGDWLLQLYDDPHITIHQFPFRERRELTPERVQELVTFIDGLQGVVLIQCVKGETRTSMVSAGYNIMKGRKGVEQALKEDYLRFTKPYFLGRFNLGRLNRSVMREIRSYGELSL